MESWRPPLDEFTLRYLMARLVDDREQHMKRAQEVSRIDSDAAEMLLVRAEECARVIDQLKKALGIRTEPPPKPKKQWPEV